MKRREFMRPDGGGHTPMAARPSREFARRGKSLNPVQPRLQKYFCFSETKSALYTRRPVPPGGALRNVTNAGRDAVDADRALDEGA